MNNQCKMAMNFWGRVEASQKEHGWTLTELCKRAELNYGTVMNSRSTARLPSLESAVALSITLGKTVEWLLTGENTRLTSQVELFNSLIHNSDLLPILKELPTASKNKINALNLILGIKE